MRAKEIPTKIFYNKHNIKNIKVNAGVAIRRVKKKSEINSYYYNKKYNITNTIGLKIRPTYTINNFYSLLLWLL